MLVTCPGTRPTDSLSALKRGAGRHSWSTRPRRRSRSARTLPNGSGTSQRWPRTWVRAAAWSSRSAQTTSATWRLRRHRAGPRGRPLPARPDGRGRPRSAIEGPARRAGLRLEPALSTSWSGTSRASPGPFRCSPRAAGDVGAPRGPDTHRRGLPGHRRDPPRRLPVGRAVYEPWTAPAQPAAESPPPPGDAQRGRRPRACPGAAGQVAADAAHRRIVEQLVGARLLSVDGDTIQIAHEALVRVGRGCAAGSTTTSTAAPLPAPGRRRRCLGRHGPSGQRALPGHPAEPHPRVAGPGHA